MRRRGLGAAAMSAIRTLQTCNFQAMTKGVETEAANMKSYISNCCPGIEVHPLTRGKGELHFFSIPYPTNI